VSDFFEPPARPPAQAEQPRYRMPEWFGPPSGTLPGVVALELVIARTERAAVCVTRIAAYPTGFTFDIITLTDREDDGLDPLLFEPPRLRRGQALPGDLLRFGVQFSDGSKVTNIGGRPFEPGRPSDPVMVEGGGGGGSGRWNQSQWIWPLPPSGPMQVVCEWPAADIPLTRTELDAQVILDAAQRAQVIFSDEHLPEPPGDDGNDAIVVIR
jgi:hypothetical protein